MNLYIDLNRILLWRKCVCKRTGSKLNQSHTKKTPLLINFTISAILNVPVTRMYSTEIHCLIILKGTAIHKTYIFGFKTIPKTISQHFLFSSFFFESSYVLSQIVPWIK